MGRVAVSGTGPLRCGVGAPPDWHRSAAGEPEWVGRARTEATSDRPVGADAGEVAPRQPMTLDVVDPRVVGQEGHVDPILAGGQIGVSGSGEAEKPRGLRRDDNRCRAPSQE